VRLGAEIENLPSKPEEVFAFSRRAQELHVQLDFLLEHEDKNTVFWIERRRTGRDRLGVSMQATPIDVGPILRECLWSKLDTVVLTSATLAVGGGFGFEMGHSLKLDKVPHNRFHLALARAVGHNLETFGKPTLCEGGPLKLA